MTKKYSPFGVHAGVTGYNVTKEYKRALNERGIPFASKYVDNAGGAWEDATIAADFPHVPNLIVLRYTKPYRPMGYDNWDRLNHRYPPRDAMNYMCDGIRKLLDQAQELQGYEKYIHIQLLCEDRAKPDHDDPNWNNMHPVKFLSEGMMAGVERVLAWGFAGVVCFGFNAGEPMPHDIHHMDEFLEFAVKHKKGQVIIGTNESCQPYYDENGVKHDHTNTPFSAFYPNTIGTSDKFHARCDKLGIPRLPVAITELAYSNDDFLPNATTANQDWLAPIYHAQQVLGAFWWAAHAAPENGGVEKKVLKYIPELERYNLTRVWTYDDKPDPLPPPDEEPPMKKIYETMHAHPSRLGVPQDSLLVKRLTRDGYKIASSEVPVPIGDKRYMSILASKNFTDFVLYAHPIRDDGKWDNKWIEVYDPNKPDGFKVESWPTG